MFSKLFRKYNQNRRTIWVIIIFIAFFVILLQTIFALIRSNRAREQEELLNAYYQNQSNNAIANNNSTENNVVENTTQVPEVITTSSSSEDIINYFVKLCNDKNVEEAYNMISTDCKEVLFPTINDFRNNYYNKVFDKIKSAKIEDSMYDGEIYKVTYTADLLSTGGYQADNILEDYIYVTSEDQEPKISLNKFIYTQVINKTGSSEGISINVLKKRAYIDYEEYQIQIVNNTDNTIYITPDEKKVFLLDENDVEYTSNIDELQNGATIIEANKISTLELTFFKTWRF